MTYHFLTQKIPWTQEDRTWRMLHRGQEVRYQKYYILGMDLCLFQNVAVRYPMHNTDHYMVLG